MKHALFYLCPFTFSLNYSEIFYIEVAQSSLDSCPKLTLFNFLRDITMPSFFTEATELKWREKTYIISAALKQMLILSTLITIIYWLIGLWLPNMPYKWGDQREQYLTGFEGLQHPYRFTGFFNPPWTLLIMFPFNFVPFEIAVLLQGILYHGILTTIAFKFTPANFDDKSKRIAALAILLSPFPADLALELNNDWVPALGLLVPPVISPIFILAKPQNAIGYFLSFRWKTLVRAVLIGSITVVLSFVIWRPDWILRAYNSIQRDSLGTNFSGAPIQLIGLIPSILIGTLLIAYVLYRVYGKPVPERLQEQQQKDLALYAVVGGLFFVPYIAGYSLALIYALLSAKVPRIMLGFNLLLWAMTIAILSIAFL